MNECGERNELLPLHSEKLMQKQSILSKNEKAVNSGLILRPSETSQISNKMSLHSLKSKSSLNPILSPLSPSFQRRLSFKINHEQSPFDSPVDLQSRIGSSLSPLFISPLSSKLNLQRHHFSPYSNYEPQQDIIKSSDMERKKFIRDLKISPEAYSPKSPVYRFPDLKYSLPNISRKH